MNQPPDFITTNPAGQERVHPYFLARHVCDHLPFLIVRNSGRNTPQIYVYQNGVYVCCDEDTFKGHIKRFITEYNEALVSMKVLNETCSLLMTDLRHERIDDLNKEENIINFENGILVLAENELQLIPHDPRFHSTVRIPCRWIEDPVDTPVFNDYLDTLTDNDPQIKELLLEFIGVVLSNVKGYRTKKALFMVGPGDSGKSQLKSLCERLIGPDNFSSCDFSDLEERFGTSDLYGKRLAGSADASHMSIKELKTFKKLTGGDSIHAEFKGQKAFDFTFNGLLWLCMNSLPKFGGDNGPWVYERIMVIECNNVIPREKQDKLLLDKMFAEREGIVQKAVFALQRVIQNGYCFNEPPCVIENRKKYMSENNSVSLFWNECMVRRSDGRKDDPCSSGKVYKVYKAWCRDNEHGFAKTASEFRADVCALLGVSSYGDLTVSRNGYPVFKDYTLSLEARHNYAAAFGSDADIGIWIPFDVGGG